MNAATNRIVFAALCAGVLGVVLVPVASAETFSIVKTTTMESTPTFVDTVMENPVVIDRTVETLPAPSTTVLESLPATTTTTTTVRKVIESPVVVKDITTTTEPLVMQEPMVIKQDPVIIKERRHLFEFNLF